MEQEFLLKIVQTWHIKNKPAFRGFKCGNCGKILHKAWHNWLNSGGFKTPVHLCNKCQYGLEIKSPRVKIDRIKIKIWSRVDIKLIKKIITNWRIDYKPIYKRFVCDLCGKNIYRAYHLWFNLDSILSEIHFCRKCAIISPKT